MSFPSGSTPGVSVVKFAALAIECGSACAAGAGQTRLPLPGRYGRLVPWPQRSMPPCSQLPAVTPNARPESRRGQDCRRLAAAAAWPHQKAPAPAEETLCGSARKTRRRLRREGKQSRFERKT
ncbi:hypothetical protein EBU71_13250 [bacterium]|nr:hypothetical protein [Candidatus Elulimicrobium humile]